MRILFLTKKLPFPERDGEAIATASLIRHLYLLKHDVTVLSVSTKKHNYNLMNIPTEVSSQVDFRIVKINTEINIFQVVSNLSSESPYHITRFIHKVFENELLKILLVKQFDIIQFEGLFLLPYLSIIRNNSTAKVIYRSHNVEGVIWKRMSKSLSNPIKKWYLNLQAERLLKYERDILNRVDAIIPISTADEKYYKEIAPQVFCECIPTGIEIREWSEQKVNFKTIYFLGALDWLPNQHGLIWFLENVLPLVKLKFAEVQMHIAGRNAPLKLLERLKKDAIFYGEIEDKSEFLKDKFVCIVPLFAGSGLKIKIIESMAEGKVVITTPIGAEGMPLNLDAYMYISTTAENMAANIIKILSSPEEFLNKAKQGADLVRTKLLNRNLVLRLLEIYQMLLK